ncbi:MAG: 23S rRNA (uracil(1939)-C(5))-methyltransferase RlmD [Clostridiaceae bacterium]|nr:23S rRNA (uracil(1939)-C(5))-methyltransferase RlmD [Clostridiaceae bacterium]
MNGSELLEKNKVYECTVQGYTAEGMGVARIEGMAVFIPCSVSGDRLQVKIVKVNKTYAYGRIDKILEPASERIEPQCPVFPKCGGCAFLHISYDEELRLKGQRVEDALHRIGGFDISIGPAHGSTRQGYRNKAQFPVAVASGRTCFGFYRERSHEVVPTEGCMLQSDSANTLARAVCLWMDESGAAPYDEESGKGLVRRIYVRSGGEGCHLCIIATSDKLPKSLRLVEIARAACPELMGVTVNVNDDNTNRIMGERCITLWGESKLSDTLLGLSFDLSPLSFYQVNHDQAEKLYQKALEYAALGESDTALDLYCGVGTITLLLAGRCRQAIGNEIVPQAVENARENAERNGITNVRFIEGDAGKVSDMLLSEGLRPDVIVCDPPRKGMDQLAIDSIARMMPARLVYISCDPASLARDAAILAEKGYSLVKAEAFDMFPGTAHVETVILMTRCGQNDK